MACQLSGVIPFTDPSTRMLQRTTTMTLRVSSLATLALAAATLAACSKGGDAGDTASARNDTTAAALPDTTRGSAGPSRVGELAGAKDSAGAAVAWSTPESVKYDEALDGYFVSNINGNPGAKDNNGFIVFVPAEGDSARVLVRGGRGGATLNAPKGLAISGDTLWVADIDAVRAFDKRTGKPVASVAVKGGIFLNDVAVGPDGAIYVTETGVKFSPTGDMSHPGPDRIYKIAGRTVSTAASFDQPIGPNGLAWDKASSRWVVLPFATNTIVTVGSDGKAQDLVSGVGEFDGIEQAKDGRWLVSSWKDSSIYAIPAGGGTPTRLITGVAAPADIGYDSKRNRVLVPSFTGNSVAIYQL
jgi:glucose/arabinose dehydrogenase